MIDQPSDVGSLDLDCQWTLGPDQGIIPESLKDWKNYKKKEDAKGFTEGIVVPLLPFGLKEFDEGERFDLRSPYADMGWVSARVWTWDQGSKDNGLDHCLRESAVISPKSHPNLFRSTLKRQICGQDSRR